MPFSSASFLPPPSHVSLFPLPSIWSSAAIPWFCSQLWWWWYPYSVSFLVQGFAFIYFFQPPTDVISLSSPTLRRTSLMPMSFFFHLNIIRFFFGDWLVGRFSGLRKLLRLSMYPESSETLPGFTLYVFSHQNCPNWGVFSVCRMRYCQGIFHLLFVQWLRFHLLLFSSYLFPYDCCLCFSSVLWNICST